MGEDQTRRELGSRRSEDICAILQLCAAYLDRADHGEMPAAELFCDDANLQLGYLSISGRDDIAAFFVKRADGQRESRRTVRHISGTPAISFVAADRARARATIAVFAGSGELPLPSAVPATVFDFVDDIVRDGRGAWRFASRRADVIFTGEGAASFARQRPTSAEDPAQ